MTSSLTYKLKWILGIFFYVAATNYHGWFFRFLIKNFLILCPAIELVWILLKARYEEMIIGSWWESEPESSRVVAKCATGW